MAQTKTVRELIKEIGNDFEWLTIKVKHYYDGEWDLLYQAPMHKNSSRFPYMGAFEDLLSDDDYFGRKYGNLKVKKYETDNKFLTIFIERF